MAAWLVTPELEDCRRRLPKNIFGGLKGLSAEETAMLLQDRLARGGILSTLDFSQCYDRMSPAISRGFLTQVGWDSKFCSMFTAAWQQQTRFVQWQGATLPEPLCGRNATLQGCPMAPLVLCTWTLAGTQDVDESLRSLTPRLFHIALQACYMDDRSVVSGRLAPN